MGEGGGELDPYLCKARSIHMFACQKPNTQGRLWKTVLGAKHPQQIALSIRPCLSIFLT